MTNPLLEEIWAIRERQSKEAGGDPVRLMRMSTAWWNEYRASKAASMETRPEEATVSEPPTDYGTDEDAPGTR